MEHVTLQIGLLSVLSVIIARTLLVQWRRYSLVRAHGCKPIVEYPKARLWRSEQSEDQERSRKDGRYNALVAEKFEKCGSSTYVQTTWDERMIHTMEPENHQVLAIKIDDWIKEPRPAVRAYVGDNIVLQSGGAGDIVGSWSIPYSCLIPRDGSAIDMQPLVRKLFIDSATDFILGESIDSLRDSSAKSHEFISAYDRATVGAGKRARPTGFLTNFYLMMKPDKAWLADCKIVHDFIDGCIARHRERASKDGPEPPRKRYVLIDGMSNVFPDPVELRFHLLSVFSLARETPSVVAGNTLFLLARNPSIWTELRRQALALGSKDTMTFDQLTNLSLFRNTVLETMRLHTPIPRIRRMAACDTVLPKGGGPDGSSPALVRKGSMVCVEKYPKFRDPKIWGDEAEAFRPSIFENRATGWEFAPFSSGPRRCPANRQVITQVIYLLYRLTLEFESIQNMEPCLRYVEGVMMCLYSRNGTLVSLKPARIADC